jgi:hypothetical protein
MLNKNLHVNDFETLMLKDYTATKINIYFCVKTAEDGYDPYENNLITKNLNPKTIRGYIHAVTPQQLIYKQYGLSNIGAVEIICDEKYLSWFKKASRIVIENIDYKCLVVGNAAGSDSNPKGAFVSKRAFKMCKVVLVRND